MAKAPPEPKPQDPTFKKVDVKKLIRRTALKKDLADRTKS